MTSWTSVVLVLTVFLCRAFPASSGDQGRLNKWMVRRFLHGCPFAFPCALPPCDNPVFGPHDCCGSCPDPEPEIVQTTIASNPSNINTRSKVFDRKAGEQRSGESRGAARSVLAARLPTTTTPPPTTTEDCPWPCVMNGQHYCHPFPCHIQCVDAIMPHGSCCEVCPNGPNCHWNGHIIPEGQNSTFDGTVVHCYNGDLYGGNIHVYNPVG